MPSGIETSYVNIASPPASPILASVLSGALSGATYYVVLTYVNNIGETFASPEAAITVADNYVFQATDPGPETNATGYSVYASLTSGDEVLQVANVAIGNNWQEPDSGLIDGIPPPTSITPVDLDSIFLSFVPGHTNAAVTGIEVAGSDLTTRYEKLSYGSASKAVGIESNGADLNTFFCKNTVTWTASLSPTYPTPFTSSPQPPAGVYTMVINQAGGPGGSYTYLWSYTITGEGGNFVIVSGQATNAITWYATATRGAWCTIKITCLVTAPNETSVSASTSIKFHYGTPS